MTARRLAAGLVLLVLAVGLSLVGESPRYRATIDLPVEPAERFETRLPAGFEQLVISAFESLDVDASYSAVILARGENYVFVVEGRSAEEVERLAIGAVGEASLRIAELELGAAAEQLLRASLRRSLLLASAGSVESEAALRRSEVELVNAHLHYRFLETSSGLLVRPVDIEVRDLNGSRNRRVAQIAVVAVLVAVASVRFTGPRDNRVG